MRTGGLLLIGSGAVLIYWVIRAGLKSLPSSSGSSSSGGSSGGGATAGSSAAAQADSGTHQAIDTTGTITGTVGNIYTVSSTYGAASDQEQDDMNAYANAIGNVSG
jgi:hypothetical protein